MPVLKEKSTLKNQQAPLEVTYKPGPIKVLLSWKAPARPFKKQSREYFTTIGAMIFLIALILVFLKEFLLIGAILALFFIVYVLSTVKPEEITHKINNRGIATGKKTYKWEQLGRFWFSEKWGNQLLNIENFFGLPARLTLLLGATPKEKVKKVLEEYLISEKPEKNFVDRASEWISKKVPLEK